MSARLHPNNDRIGDEGIGDSILEYLNYYRFPPVYITEHGEHKHETPLCPHVSGHVHYAICREDALYVYGERWCRTCRWYDTERVPYSRETTGWTDPRYREGR